MRVSQNVYALRNVILAPERHLKECNQNTVCLCVNIEMYLQDIYFKYQLGSKSAKSRETLCLVMCIMTG